MSEKLVEAEGRRVEYQALRSEILHSDRTCLVILALLLAVSGTILGIVVDGSKSELVSLLPPLWIVGWCYISEKRFMIRRTAHYIRHEIEGHTWGLVWQNWLRRNRKELDRHFLRFVPI